MALPAAIQAQVEQADALLAAMNAPPEAGQPQQAQAQEVDLGQLAQTANAANAPQAEPQATTVPLKPAPEETWESRYKSLHGIFNREVPALHQQVKELTKRLEQAEKARAEEAAKPVEQVAHKPEADPRDVENFGTDLVEMVHRTAERVFGGVAQKVDAELAKLVARLTTLEQLMEGTTQTVAATAEDKFFDKLAAKVPDWEQVNVSDAFIAWLQEVDPVYGVPRQAALTNAREQLDAQRAANVFLAFKASASPTPPDVANPVDKQVSPKTGAASPAPTQPTKPIVTQKQISDFYNDVARRRYVGREAEASAIEQMINLAIAEGRVR